jgi:magnesium transporter
MQKITNDTNDITNFNDSILFNLKSKDVGALKRILNSANEADLLNIINELSAENQVIAYRLLAKDKALFVFEQLDTADQEKLMRSFTEEAAIEMITELDPDDRVRLLDELPATVARRMLAALSVEERAATNLLMGYEAYTAGRIMTPEYASLSGSMTAFQALEKVKQIAKDKETIYNLYITDNARKLEGVLSLRDLLIANPDDKIETIMQKNPVQTSTDTDQEEVAKLLQKLDLLTIPVVDKEERLVGIITVDDAMDILEEEATEDIFHQAGLTGTESARSDVLVNGNLWKIWKVRVPFLLYSLLAAILSGIVIDGFEETLESIAVIAIFIPLIMTMGGNVGTQSSTVFARGIALGHIDMKNFSKPFMKEVGVGLSLGLIIGVSSGIIAALWQGMPMLGLAVGLALIITITLAALLGFLVPYVLIKLNIDQAAGAAPIITSIKDISGLVIYFVLVSTFLRHLL